jgi:hypothetical protein
LNPARRFIGKRGSEIRFSTTGGESRSPGGWIICLVTPRQSVTVNSLTTRPGNVNVTGRLISAWLMLRTPEFLIRSSTSEGSATSSR